MRAPVMDPGAGRMHPLDWDHAPARRTWPPSYSWPSASTQLGRDHRRGPQFAGPASFLVIRILIATTSSAGLCAGVFYIYQEWARSLLSRSNSISVSPTAAIVLPRLPIRASSTASKEGGSAHRRYPLYARPACSTPTKRWSSARLTDLSVPSLPLGNTLPLHKDRPMAAATRLFP